MSKEKDKNVEPVPADEPQTDGAKEADASAEVADAAARGVEPPADAVAELKHGDEPEGEVPGGDTEADGAQEAAESAQVADAAARGVPVEDAIPHAGAEEKQDDDEGGSDITGDEAPAEDEPVEPEDETVQNLSEATHIVAIGDVNVHLIDSEVAKSEPLSITSRVLGAGDSVPVAEVAPYILKDIEAGNEPRLKLVSKDKADEIAAAVAANAPLEDPGMNQTSTATPDGQPQGDDVDGFASVGEDGRATFHSA